MADRFVVPAGPGPLYDSAAPQLGLRLSVRRLRHSMPLVGVLVRRDLVVRYGRSVLGPIWALLTPILTVVVLWGVFESVFPVADLGIPYAVYLASGILGLTAMQQGVLYLGSSMQVYEPLLSKIRIPAEVLAAGSLGGIGVHLGLSLVATLLLQVFVGVSVPWTVVLVPLVLACLLAFAGGVGMLVAGIAIRFPDVLHVVSVALYLLGFVTPTFYRPDALDEPARSVVEGNPVTHYLDLLRGCLYEGHVGSIGGWSYAVALGAAALLAGIASYSRAARRALVTT